jgi:hypothetical protein
VDDALLPRLGGSLALPARERIPAATGVFENFASILKLAVNDFVVTG